MRIVKRFFKGVFWLLILVLLVAPLGLIYHISQGEMQEYQAPTVPVLRETAFGSIAQARREDVAECISVSGTFVSKTWGYMELTQKNPNLIRWDVTVGDEVREGQILGDYRGESIVSTLTGIVLEINSYNPENAYLKVQLLEPLELECHVTDRILTTLKHADAGMSTENGEAVTLTYAALTKNKDGTTTVRLSIASEDYSYGETVEDLNLMTGRSYTMALVLPAKCLYQKTVGEEQPWYARQVTAGGYFISEVEVNVGYSDGKLVCVSGINEGDYFDTGYQAISQGSAS